jgi:hypothetical protein
VFTTEGHVSSRVISESENSPINDARIFEPDRRTQNKDTATERSVRARLSLYIIEYVASTGSGTLELRLSDDIIRDSWLTLSPGRDGCIYV